jgi:hypothetical protein
MIRVAAAGTTKVPIGGEEWLTVASTTTTTTKAQSMVMRAR